VCVKAKRKREREISKAFGLINRSVCVNMLASSVLCVLCRCVCG